MQKSFFSALALAALVFGSVACSETTTTSTETTTESTTAPAAATDSAMQNAPATAVVYTCPMHPEVTSAQPGECPKCHMDLEVKK